MRDLPFEGALRGIDPGSGDVVLRTAPLASDAAVRVRLVTPGGAPIPDARVHAHRRGWADASSSARTDEDGRATLEGLTERGYDVRVDWSSPEQQAWARAERLLPPRSVQLTPAGQEIVLRAREARVISGNVLLADGSNAGYCGVEARSRDDVVGQATSDDRGAFVLLVPAEVPGPVTLSARFYTRERELLAGEKADVQPGHTDVQVIVSAD
jgi:hypothetical protein